jgi:hypothetical protein
MSRQLSSRVAEQPGIVDEDRINFANTPKCVEENNEEHHGHAKRYL